MADAVIAPFVMHGARDAMASGFAHIKEQVKGIEQSCVGNPGLAFDLAKTLIESTCRTVLSERSVPYAATDDLPKLFKLASQNLPFLPATTSDAGEVRKSLKQTLGGLSTAIQGICELRNQCGSARVSPVVVRQGLNHSRPAVSVPIRASTPSETISAALKAKSAGSSAL